MFKKTMTFDDLDGNEVTETFYFNYNKKEIAELMEFGYLGEFPPADTSRRMQLEKQLEMLSTPVEESGLSEQENTRMAYNIFQDLILDAYGEKSADNRTFNKSDELRRRLKNHVAFVEIIFEFVENPKMAADFIENCLPAKFVEQAKKELADKYDGKLTSSTLAAMVEEADRRQQDPATRIEPGLEAARAALGESPEMEKAALSLVDAKAMETNIEDLTETDILEMDEAAFNKLDIQKLNKQQMMAAFRRKSQS